ncbi:MAG: NAD(+) kinase [Anaerolinea sp.]|nr:NAD(+) kinase [Anaerolinea sp.]
MHVEKMPIPQRIAIVAHSGMPDAFQEIDRVKSALGAYPVEVVSGRLDDAALRKSIASGEYDLAIVLGGDGSILRTGHLCATSNTPILGINFGRFGFLMEIQRANWMEYIPQLMQGNYRYESRMMLNAEHWRAGEKLGEWDVVNEVVVCRGQLVKPVHITAYVDNELLSTYVADGLIAATASGSTAYALAAGGPIMPPELRNILLVPVAPHLSVDRAVILAEGAQVSITARSDHQAVLSVDGQNPILLLEHDRVEVSAGDHTLRFVRFFDAGYFYRSLMSHMEQNPAADNYQ